jgi:hypothetical protein
MSRKRVALKIHLTPGPAWDMAAVCGNRNPHRVVQLISKYGRETYLVTCKRCVKVLAEFSQVYIKGKPGKLKGT